MSVDTGTVAYIDSSALVKLVVPEKETEVLLEFIQGCRLVSSRLAEVETNRAVEAVGGDEHMRIRAREVLETVDLIELSPQISATAGSMPPPSLRSLDAIHLASALALDDELGAMIVYDRRLKKAAAGKGLTTESPGASVASENVISRSGKPVAKLGPLNEEKGVRNIGIDRGLFEVPSGFDEPLPEEVLDDFEQ